MIKLLVGMGMEFATCIPVPEIGNGIFHSHSRSRNWGMEFVIPVPVPEAQKSFPLTPDQSLNSLGRNFQKIFWS